MRRPRRISTKLRIPALLRPAIAASVIPWVLCIAAPLAEAMPAATLDSRSVHWTGTNFPAPAALRPAVVFWRELFLRYDSGQAILHDREHLDVVWAIIDLPRTANGKTDERLAARMLRSRFNDTRERLRRMENGAGPADDTDRALLALSSSGGAPLTPGASDRLHIQRGVAEKFRAGRQRAARYMPTLLPILKEEGVPLELAALPFVESMFKPRVRSFAGAVGLWQLMAATARALGLRVDRRRDERYDINKSTRAAARMLMGNFRMLGSWPLALTAYNHGPYGVQRAVQAVGSTDLMQLIEHYKEDTWGFASKNFYAEFLAILEILADDPMFAAQLSLRTTEFRSTAGSAARAPAAFPPQGRDSALLSAGAEPQ